jgi:hypothetical protein
MNAFLNALARWGPSAVASAAAAAALLLVVAGFALGVAHGTASAVAYSGTAGVLVLVAAIGYQAARGREA